MAVIAIPLHRCILDGAVDPFDPAVGPKMVRFGRPARSIVHTDGLGAYDALDVSAFHHVPIKHSERVAEDATHINGIENFETGQSGIPRGYNGSNGSPSGRSFPTRFIPWATKQDVDP